MAEVTCKPHDSLLPNDPARCVVIIPFTKDIENAHVQAAQMRDRGEWDPTNPVIIKALSPAPLTDEWKSVAGQLGWQFARDDIAVFHVFTLAGWVSGDEKLANYYREIVFAIPYKKVANPQEIVIRVRVFYHHCRVVLTDLPPISPAHPSCAYIEEWPVAGFAGTGTAIRLDAVPIGEREKAIKPLTRLGWQMLRMEPLSHRGRSDLYIPDELMSRINHGIRRMAKARIKPNRSSLARELQLDRKTTSKWFENKDLVNQFHRTYQEALHE